MAYSSYQYETSPRKLKPAESPMKKSTTQKKVTTSKKKTTVTKQRVKPQIKAIMYIAIGFAILFAISYRNSLITASFTQRENLKKQLSTLKKENAQTEVNIQTSLNLVNIEQSASSKLGMKKLDDSQKVYISLPKKDYVETASEQVIVTETQNWFEKLLENITNFIK